VVGDGGNDTVAGGPDGVDFLVGGSGDDVMISSDDGVGSAREDNHDPRGANVVDKVNGGDDFDVCFFGAGDEISNCEYKAERNGAAPRRGCTVKNQRRGRPGAGDGPFDVERALRNDFDVWPSKSRFPQIKMEVPWI
jgi:hypothetical protein